MRYSARPITWPRFARSALTAVALLVFTSPGRATTVIPPEFEELVRQSDYVVRAKVKEMESRWQEREGHRVIMTFVTLEVLDRISGEVPDSPVLQMLGGQVGTQKMTLVGAPKFEIGDEDILFVQGNGRQVSPLTAMMHGRYRIVRQSAANQSYVARENGLPLTSVDEVAQPLHEEHNDHHSSLAAALPPRPALSPSEFISRIRAVEADKEPVSQRE